MKELDQSWFYQGLVDYEYKKYVLLAHLQWAESQFNNARLYPAFSSLIENFRTLNSFRIELENASEQMPRVLSGINLEKLMLEFEEIRQESGVLDEVKKIVEYAIPLIRTHLEKGKSLYELIEENITIDVIGLLPINKESGYILLTSQNSSDVMAYQYQMTIFESANEKYRGIHTHFVSGFTHSFSNTFETIKHQLIRQNSGLPNPATYLVRSSLGFPLNESFLPVTKRMLMRMFGKPD